MYKKIFRSKLFFIICPVIIFVLQTGCSSEQVPERKSPVQLKPDIRVEFEIEEVPESLSEHEFESDAVPEQDLKNDYSAESFNAGDIIDKSLLDIYDIDRFFCASDIAEGDEVYLRIIGKSYVENDDISLSNLCYLKMPHYNFDGNIQMGEMIVNKSIADEVLLIFRELFNREYQIESMRLIDDYWMGDGDSSDTNSVKHNNSSAFCYRLVAGTKTLSNHAYGLAIDINPQQNPYVSYKSGVPVWSDENSNDYIDRETGLPHVITHSDPAYELFKEYGFSWGGDWKSIKDYQHFEHK